MDKIMAQAILTTWAGFGLKVEKMQGDTIFISVPEHSYSKNVKGEEMAGSVLAKRFKTSFSEMGVNMIVKARIRNGENWTEEDRKSAEKRSFDIL